MLLLLLFMKINSEDVVLFCDLSLESGLIVGAGDIVLEGAPNSVVSSLSKVTLGLISEHPVL